MSVCTTFDWTQGSAPNANGNGSNEYTTSNGVLGTNSRITRTQANGNLGTQTGCPCGVQSQDLVRSKQTWVVTELPATGLIHLSNNPAQLVNNVFIFPDGSFTVNPYTAPVPFPAGSLQVGDEMVWENIGSLGVGIEEIRLNGVVLVATPAYPMDYRNYVYMSLPAVGVSVDNVTIERECLTPPVPKTLNLQMRVNFVNANTDLTLPTPQACDINRFYVKSIGDNDINLFPASGTIDGQPNLTVSGDGVGVELFFDGTNWFVLSNTVQ